MINPKSYKYLYLLAAAIAVCLVIIYRRTVLKSVGLDSLNTAIDSKNLVTIAQSQVGVRETTQNRGLEVETYLKTVGLDYSNGYTSPGYSWCAAFIKWCMVQANIPTPGMNGLAASCFNSNNDVYSGGVYHQAVQPGDVFTIYYAKAGRVGHAGIITGIDGDNFSTVEGNTNDNGSNNGDGVYSRTRALSKIYQISRWT